MNKPYSWDPEKNRRLKVERGFGFEDVVQAIADGNLLDVIINPSE